MQLRQIKENIAGATGIRTLNEIQNAAAAFDGGRMVLLAPTGSGKTLAYVIAMLRRLELKDAGHGTLALVLAPTRELALQIYNVMRPVARGFKTVAFYGGHRMSDEVSRTSTAPADIIVATPGRLLDHLEHATVDLSRLQVLVIDEYDKSLELGFSEQMGKIARRVRHPRLMALTSATPIDAMPDYIDADRAAIIDFTASDKATLPDVTVMSVPSPGRDKLETLGSLLRSIRSDRPSIVFVNHRESVERVNSWLRRHGIASMPYHGGLDQRQREIALAALDSGAVPVLVATDLAGRGLDIADLGAAIHYHMPQTEQVWTHRNGRTARAGRAGQVYVITGPDEDVPDYVVTDHDYYPDMTDTDSVVDSEVALLYIDAGRRDKVSRGDVAGFAIKQAGVAPDMLGRITIGADYALLAVKSASDADKVIKTATHAKLKGRRVRITHI